jgi:hypothetical protein
MAYEEPAYEVVGEYDAYEIRRYFPYLIAEITVDQPFEAARNEAFRRLFRYISGDNRTAESMEAGAVSATTRRGGTKIKMTIPVVSTTPTAQPGPDDAPGFTTYFVVPSKYTLETVPQPNDTRILIRQVPERLVAVRRYSGRITESNYRENERVLLEALRDDRVTIAGDPVFAVYDSPFTLWFLRRNEVMIDIAR